MRTTIIKTDIWKDDELFSLHLDSKMVYLFILTSPERGALDIFKWSSRMASAYTGITKEQIERGIEELIQRGFIAMKYDYVVILKDHLAQNGGRYKTINESRELGELPDEVLTFYSNIRSVEKKTIEKSADGSSKTSEVLAVSKANDPERLITDEDRLVTEKLFEFINKSRPDQSAKEYKPKTSDFTAIRLMRERDGVTSENMLKVIELIPLMPFWGEKFIIRSAPNFRSKWQQLVSSSRDVYNKAMKNRVVEI